MSDCLLLLCAHIQQLSDSPSTFTQKQYLLQHWCCKTNNKSQAQAHHLEQVPFKLQPVLLLLKSVTILCPVFLSLMQKMDFLSLQRQPSIQTARCIFRTMIYSAWLKNEGCAVLVVGAVRVHPETDYFRKKKKLVLEGQMSKLASILK